MYRRVKLCAWLTVLNSELSEQGTLNGKLIEMKDGFICSVRQINRKAIIISKIIFPLVLKCMDKPGKGAHGVACGYQAVAV